MLFDIFLGWMDGECVRGDIFVLLGWRGGEGGASDMRDTKVCMCVGCVCLGMIDVSIYC